MNHKIGLNLGEQPIAQIMSARGLKPHDLVAASSDRITHKMVSKACKGRQLTQNVQTKICNALNEIGEEKYFLKDLFTY